MGSKALSAALLGTMFAMGHEFSYLGNSTCNQCKDKGLDIDEEGYSICDACPFSAVGFEKFMSEEEG